jgi:uncharacterized protein
MTATTQSAQTSVRRAAGVEMIIDTDVHERLQGSEVLLPYLGAPWHRYITEFAFKGISSIRGGSPYGLTGGDRLDWSSEIGPAGTSVDVMRKHLFEEEQESYAILSGLFHVSALTAQFEFAAALASAYNDWQIDQWLDKEPRLLGAVHVIANDPAGAAREIDRVADHPQIVQVFLPTILERQYGDPFYDPIYEAANRHKLAVSFHHGPATKTPLGYPRYFAEWHSMAAPLAAMNQLTSLVFNGTLDKFPEVKFVLLEASIGWLPWAMSRLDENAREFRMEVPWIKTLPSETIRRSVRMSTQPMAEVKPRDFVRIVDQVGSDELFLFSSDYPHYDGDNPSAAFPETLDQGLREKVFYKNALGTYPRLEGLLA